MAGWGEERGSITLADRLAAAVRCWATNPTTGNLERMIAALEAYERDLLHAQVLPKFIDLGVTHVVLRTTGRRDAER